MEPDDPTMDPGEPTSPPLSWVGDPLGPAPAGASVEALRAVLARHRRRQRVLAGVGLAVVLVAGSVAGFAVGQQGRATGATQVAAADQPSAGTPASGPAAVPSAVGGGWSVRSTATGTSSSPDTQLLVRDATDGVRVRLYEQSLPTPACAPNSTCAVPAEPSCVPSQLLEAEVSDDQVAGQTGGPLWQSPSTSGLDPVGTQVVGDGQPQPILVVIAHTGSDVAEVTVATSYGDDTEAPTSSGWVALAVQLPAAYQPSGSSDLPAGTLTARSGSGATIATTPLEQLNPKMPPASCLPRPPACPAALGAATSASAASTSTTASPTACGTCTKVATAGGGVAVTCSASGSASGTASAGASGGMSLRMKLGSTPAPGVAGTSEGGAASAASSTTSRS